MQLRRSGQAGFTLIEVIIAVAISAVLFGGAVGVLNRMTGENDRASKDMAVTQQIESAGYWVGKDALKAQQITAGESAGFPLRLEWQNWNLDANNQVVTNRVEFSLSGNSLQRTQSVGTASTGWSIVQQTIVARNIDEDNEKTFCSYSGNVITLNLTAVIETTGKTHVYQIKPRPDTAY